MKKKVAFIISHLGHGGHQKMMSFVAESCVKHFEEVHMIEIFNSEVKVPLDESVILHNIYEGTENNNTKIGKIKSARNILSTAKELRKKLKDIDPDIICAFGIKDILLSVISSFFLKIRIVGSERRSPESYNWRVKLLTKVFYRYCDGMVFQLENAKDFFSNSIKKKSMVIPNPYKSNKEHIQYDVNKRNKTITTAAARFEPQKGIDTLIKAFNLVHEKHNDYNLIIFGSGRLIDEYRSLVSSLDLNEYVQFPGLVKNVAETVLDSAVFVLPSRLEGIPNVLMEVLGAGVPVVATDCPPGGPRLLTNNGNRGILVEVDDSRKMATAICRIIEDKKLAEKLSVKGPEVIEEFGESKIANLWVDFFQYTLNKN